MWALQTRTQDKLLHKPGGLNSRRWGKNDEFTDNVELRYSGTFLSRAAFYTVQVPVKLDANYLTEVYLMQDHHLL